LNGNESIIFFNSTPSELHVRWWGLYAKDARLVRIERKLSMERNPVARARLAGFYEFMLGLPSSRESFGDKLSVPYDQGRNRGRQVRAFQKGRPWCETEIEKNITRWTWRLYREGWAVTWGKASSRIKAEKAAFDAQMDDVEHLGSVNNRYPVKFTNLTGD
jgi:hypothetical protein